MKRLFFLMFSIVLFNCTIRAQENPVIEKWSDNTAFTIPARKWESGIFQSFRYGLTDKLELRTNAIILPVLPNVGIKVALGSSGDFIFSSEHSVSYPSFFLNTMAMKGIGGLISPEFTFPFILAINNSLVVSKTIGTSSLLSANTEVCFAIRGSKPDYQSSIDVVLLYPRMAHYYQGASIRAGVSFKGTIIPRLYYEEAARIFMITRPNDNFFVENSGTVLWAVGKSLRIRAGYILSWGKYPFGNNLQLGPAVDLIFGSKR
jgi:hypothetical protein